MPRVWHEYGTRMARVCHEYGTSDTKQLQFCSTFALALLQTRNWQSISGCGCEGRFVPDTAEHLPDKGDGKVMSNHITYLLIYLLTYSLTHLLTRSTSLPTYLLACLHSYLLAPLEGDARRLVLCG